MGAKWGEGRWAKNRQKAANSLVRKEEARKGLGGVAVKRATFRGEREVPFKKISFDLSRVQEESPKASFPGVNKTVLASITKTVTAKREPLVKQVILEEVSYESLMAEINMGGRPVDSRDWKKYMSEDALIRLSELGFDPIDKMVKMYDEVSAMLLAEESKMKPSAMKIAALVASKQKCINDLMRYRYARVSETSVVETKTIKPIKIGLTRVGHKPFAGLEELIVDPSEAIIIEGELNGVQH